MSVSSRRPLAQWLYVLRVCLLIIMGLYMYNDYLQTAVRPQYTAVTNRGDTAAASPLLPLSSYVHHHDGDIFYVTP